MLCITGIVLATKRPGSILRLSKRRPGREDPSNTAHGGGEIRSEFTPLPDEIVAQEHWCSSGFANTDKDLLLKRHGIHKLITIGLIAHTSMESTVRFAAELGYEVTVVKDATADYSDKEMHAALDINLPSYANAIMTTLEMVQSISSLTPLKAGARE